MFFEKANTIDKILMRLGNKKREGTNNQNQK